jgi:hypothetical protein
MSQALGPFLIIVGLVVAYVWMTVLIKVRTHGKVSVTLAGQDHRVEEYMVKVGVDGDPRRIAPKCGGEYLIEEEAVWYKEWPSNLPSFMRTTVPCLYYEKDNPHPRRLLDEELPKATANTLKVLFAEGFMRMLLKDAEDNFREESGKNKLSPQKLGMYLAMGAAFLSGLSVYLIYQLMAQVGSIRSLIGG